MSEAGHSAASWEHFRHGADIGIRGVGASLAQAFEQAALALTAIVTPPVGVGGTAAIEIRCRAGSDEFMFLDWINALIYEMATRDMLFSRFRVGSDAGALVATALGEPVDVARQAYDVAHNAGAPHSLALSFGSACHAAGRSISRHQAARQYGGRQVQDALAARGILVKSPSSRRIAEEAPGACKDVAEVVDAAERAGLARSVARLEPKVCIKG